jgi:hypothetical protein
MTDKSSFDELFDDSVRDASRSSSDAMPDRADAPELLDVEMDQFA